MPVEVRVCEDARLHQVVDEVWPLLQVVVDIRESLAEGLQDHSSV